MKMLLLACAVFVAFGLGLDGCATAPSAREVLPGSGKDAEAFRRDDTACRQWAEQQHGTLPQSDAAYEQCMSARGNQVIGPAGSASESDDEGSDSEVDGEHWSVPPPPPPRDIPPPPAVPYPPIRVPLPLPPSS